MNDCPRVRRTFWYPIFLPMAMWGTLLIPVVIVREDLPPFACAVALSVYLLVGVLFQLLIGLPLLSLFNHLQRFWSRVWLAGFAAMGVACIFSFEGAFLSNLLCLAPPFMLGAAYTHYRNRPTASGSEQTDIQKVLLLTVWLGILFSAMIILNLVQIFHAPGTKTTSFDPWCNSVVFVPTAVLSLFTRGLRAGRWTAPLACTACFAGLALLFYLDYTSKYLPYLEYISRSQNGVMRESSHTSTSW